MKLSYRGASYQLSQKHIPVVESDTSATFLGRHYRIRQAQTTDLTTPTTELTYRGIKYVGRL